MPTTKQILNRMHDGHRDALGRIRDGRPLLEENASVGAIRGMRQVMFTLNKWGAVEDGKLTDIGRELIEGWNSKFSGWDGR